MEQRIDLRSTLQELGIKNIFSRNADLSAMTGTETGTETGTVTGPGTVTLNVISATVQLVHQNRCYCTVLSCTYSEVCFALI